MGRVSTYLVDRAIIRYASNAKNKGVVTNRNAGVVLYEDRGTWIPARLRPVKGDEGKDGVVTDLPHSHELVINVRDEAGDHVVVLPSDRFDVRMSIDGALTDRLTNFKIVGVVRPIRKTSKMVSYLIPVLQDTEH